jgi:hypothetical protein
MIRAYQQTKPRSSLPGLRDTAGQGTGDSNSCGREAPGNGLFSVLCLPSSGSPRASCPRQDETSGSPRPPQGGEGGRRPGEEGARPPARSAAVFSAAGSGRAFRSSSLFIQRALRAGGNDALSRPCRGTLPRRAGEGTPPDLPRLKRALLSPAERGKGRQAAVVTIRIAAGLRLSP